MVRSDRFRGRSAMNRMTLAGTALLAAAAVTVPVLAWSAGETGQATMAQTGPEQAGGAPMGGQMGGGFGHPGGMGPWMRRAMAQSPEQACVERLARRAGFAAYVGAKLNLTAEQRPLWDKLQATLQANRDKQRQLCGALKPASGSGDVTVLDRLQHREQVLSAQLQAVQQAEPAIQALYQALTPEQKAIVDHPFRRG
jgi:hypothetical protein